MLLSCNENSERGSNPMLLLLYLYLSRSTFLVSFADPNKQLPNVQSVFKFLNCRFITFLGIEILCFIKQCPLKFMSANK